ncbi:hypothetical protein LRY29_02155 [Candidatus Saccharibacteria bacterium]|nr:hypothetical protein [Candidatus Saccharibacteria bacterium]
MRKSTIIGLVAVVGVVLIGVGILVGVSSYNQSIESEEASELQAVEQAITGASGGLITVQHVAFGLDGFSKHLTVGLVAEDGPPTTEQIRQLLKAIRASYPDDTAYLSLSVTDAQGALIDIGQQLKEIGVEEIDIVNGYELTIRTSSLQQLRL